MELSFQAWLLNVRQMLGESTYKGIPSIMILRLDLHEWFHHDLCDIVVWKFTLVLGIVFIACPENAYDANYEFLIYSWKSIIF